MKHRKMTSSLRALFPAAALFALLLGAGTGEFWTEADKAARAPRNMPNPAESFAPLAREVMPAVVTVYTKATGTFLLMPYRMEGNGSGSIITSDGYILTNNHVIKGAESIRVSVGVDRKKDYPAKLIGSDPDIDVALLKIEAADLPVLPLGDSDELQVGDWVAAIGSPFDFPHTFTVGVVSAKGRRLGLGNYDDFIQTDASINSGNSGGPLVNIYGEVVGVNTLIVSPGPMGGNVGIGFSIPINLVKTILPQLKETGKVVRSWLGVSIDAVSEDAAQKAGLAEPRGALIAGIVVGGPADKAGLKIGDIIVEFDGNPILDSHDLTERVAIYGAGRAAPLTVVRDGKTITINVTLEQKPERAEMAKMEMQNTLGVENPLGAAVSDITPEAREKYNLKTAAGVVITAVAPDSAAEKNNLRAGDVITRINLTRVNNTADFERALGKLYPGKMVTITLLRGKGIVRVTFNMP